MEDMLDTVTTVPLTPSPSGILTFWEAMLQEQDRVEAARMAAKRSGDPLWAVVLILVGSALSVGVGAFIITLAANGAIG